MKKEYWIVEEERIGDFDSQEEKQLECTGPFRSVKDAEKRLREDCSISFRLGEHENLEELRMINNAAFYNQNLMNNPQLFAEYQQRVINMRTGEADYLRLIQYQERMLDNHDLRMKTYRMMLRTREERMNN